MGSEEDLEMKELAVHNFLGLNFIMYSDRGVAAVMQIAEPCFQVISLC